MSHVLITALSARSVAVLLAPAGVRYRLPQRVAWVLNTADGQVVDQGSSDVVALFLEGLEPGRAYHLTSDVGAVSFETPPCAGLVDIRDFGATPDSDNNAGAIQAALAHVVPGGTIRVPSGRYLSGPIFLKSNITLHLERGAELAAIADRDTWPILPARDASGRVIGTWEGLPEASYAALVTAVDCDDLKITGLGVIDGGGDRGDWWQWPKETRNGARRPRTVHLAYSNSVSLSGVTIRNSPSWTLHPYRCAQLTATVIRIQNPPDSPNTDGLNPESCEDTVLSGIHFSVGDDCIAIKAGKRAEGQVDHIAPTKGVEITHCRMERGHGAVVLGSEMSGDILDVTIRDCEFSGTDRGLRLKTRRGRGGRIAGVHLENVVMDHVATPVAANAFYFCDPDGHDDWVQTRDARAVDDTTPEIADIHIKKVLAWDVSTAAVALLGLPEMPFRNIRISQLQVSFDPQAEPEIPLMASGLEPVLHKKIYAEYSEIEGEVTLLHNEKGTIAC